MEIFRKIHGYNRRDFFAPTVTRDFSKARLRVVSGRDVIYVSRARRITTRKLIKKKEKKKKKRAGDKRRVVKSPEMDHDMRAIIYSII